VKNFSDSLSPTNKIGYLINHLAFVLSRQSDQVLLERLGLGFSQFKILMVLKDNPHVQQKAIAEMLGQTEAGVSRQIKLLHEQGLLHTTRRAEDKREHITTLTAKGERFTDEALAILSHYHQPVFGSLSEKEQRSLVASLQRLHQETCLSGKAGSCHQMFDTN
jgi:DNA-binding MarR family transcriptional regulator